MKDTGWNHKQWEINGCVGGILVCGFIFIVAMALLLFSVSAEAYIWLYIFIPAVIMSGGWLYYYIIRLSRLLD